jgi:hypothetical protein
MQPQTIAAVCCCAGKTAGFAAPATGESFNALMGLDHPKCAGYFTPSASVRASTVSHEINFPGWLKTTAAAQKSPITTIFENTGFRLAVGTSLK